MAFQLFFFSNLSFWMDQVLFTVGSAQLVLVFPLPGAEPEEGDGQSLSDE